MTDDCQTALRSRALTNGATHWPLATPTAEHRVAVPLEVALDRELHELAVPRAGCDLGGFRHLFVPPAQSAQCVRYTSISHARNA